MGTLGASLKRKENLSARLADALAWLYIGSAICKRFVDDGQPDRDLPAFRWAMANALHEIETALVGLVNNLPSRLVAFGLGLVMFPFGANAKSASDRVTSQLARSILDDGPARLAFTSGVFLPNAQEPGLGFLEAALDKVVAARPVRDRIKEAQRSQLLPRGGGDAIVRQAVDKNVITEAEARALREADEARDAAVQVDAFPAEELAPTATAAT